MHIRSLLFEKKKQFLISTLNFEIFSWSKYLLIQYSSKEKVSASEAYSFIFFSKNKYN